MSFVDGEHKETKLRNLLIELVAIQVDLESSVISSECIRESSLAELQGPYAVDVERIMFLMRKRKEILEKVIELSDIRNILWLEEDDLVGVPWPKSCGKSIFTRKEEES